MMKQIYRVIGATDCTDYLQLELYEKAAYDSLFPGSSMSASRPQIHIPSTVTTRRTYHIGRLVSLEIKPL